MHRDSLAVVLAVLALAGCGETTEPSPPSKVTAQSQAAATLPIDTDHHRVQLRWERGLVSFVGSTPVTSRMPTRRGKVPAGSWIVESLDGAGRVLHAEAMPDPRRLRGEFHGDKHIDGHHIDLDEADFVARISRGTEMVRVRQGDKVLGSVRVPVGGAP